MNHSSIGGEAIKKCGKCKIFKDEWQFSKDMRAKDGLFRWCKACWSNHDASRNLKLRIDCFALFGSKCMKCGSTDFDSLTINHIKSPKDPVYISLRRSGVMLYKQILDNPSVTKHFSLLCANCNWFDRLKKMKYHNSKVLKDALNKRKVKNEICSLWNYKCFKCFKTFPFELLTINHVNGGGRAEMKERSRSMFYLPKEEVICRIDFGELELNCFSCNTSRDECSKWIKLALQKV